ncbi:MAG: addiction module toxin, HicA family [Candidatus Ryanbacteria bacterium RIFCSPLOWO2_12_FULL_47_9c]|uniref:Addiction module toxin, HicA family n=1 Tax=Candidatus Ryanbacteria bacterium RIFCSPLOWO2_12_FULL_47_9c TaxID=1802131 RepID=A0A1G2H3W0_9BACT|nr:MAG: addiction module toxin, HicA family [Candidatus Ryanbacteria bacterium RIFCSPLOWO2_12_FULL_47_9c]
MKRVDLLRHLRKMGVIFVREGARHSVFLNPQIGKTSTVQRHNEIDDFLIRKICRDLGIQEPKR